MEDFITVPSLLSRPSIPSDLQTVQNNLCFSHLANLDPLTLIWFETWGMSIVPKVDLPHFLS